MSERSNERTWLHSAVVWLERIFDRLRRRVGGLFIRRQRPLQVVPYRTYGTTERLEVRGRVLALRVTPAADVSDSWLRNVRRTVRSFLTYEVPDVPVQVTRGGEQAIGRSDEEGYFTIDLPIQGAIGWTQATVTVQRASPAQAEVLVPSKSSHYLVISDIDDTLLPSGATRTATLIRTTLLGNAFTRVPFPGIVDFYSALVAGRDGDGNNPIFYVSSSPWNLYSFLTAFFAAHGLPVGPVMLRDLGVDAQTFIHGSHEDHKLAEIRRILDTYPWLPAVLIGDSGQRDPEIYTAVAAEYPGRVLAIYLRDVGGPVRRSEVEALTSTSEGVPVVTATDTSEFAVHAASAGLIADPAL